MGKDGGLGGIRLVQGWALSAPAGTQWGQCLYSVARGCSRPTLEGQGWEGQAQLQWTGQAGQRGQPGPGQGREAGGPDGQAGPGLAGHLRADVGAQVPSAHGGGLSLGGAGTKPEMWGGGLFGLQLQGQSSRHCGGGSGASDPVSSDVGADGGHSLSSSWLCQHRGTSTGLPDAEPGTPAPWGLGSRPSSPFRDSGRTCLSGLCFLSCKPARGPLQPVRQGAGESQCKDPGRLCSGAPLPVPPTETPPHSPDLCPRALSPLLDSAIPEGRVLLGPQYSRDRK